MDDLSLFSYRSGHSFFHTIPAGIKILSLCLFTIIIFVSNWYAIAFFAIVFYALGILCGFTFKEAVREQKWIVYYGLFLIICIVVMTFFSNSPQDRPSISWYIIIKPTLLFTARLLITTQYATLVFKTTSTRNILSVFESIEKLLPARLCTTRISLMFTLLFTFIPRIFEAWHNLSFAWEARAGMNKKRNGVQKIRVLIPALFSVLLEKASDIFYAVSARNI